MARTFVALGLFLATSIGFAGPAPAQYNPIPNPSTTARDPTKATKVTRGIRAASKAATKATKAIRAANKAATRATKGIRAANKAATRATRLDAPMVSNSTPDRTVALRRRPRCRHARQGSNSTRARTAAYTRCRAE